MDNKSLELLEFPKVRDLVAGYTSFDVSRDLALLISPLSDPSALAQSLGQSAEARNLLNSDTSFVIGPLRDIRETVKMASLGSILDPLMLLDIQQMLSTMRVLKKNLVRRSTEFSLLWQVVVGISELPQIEKDIDRCISPSGEIQDSASQELSDIRRKLRKTREHLLSRLESTLRSARGKKIVQEPIITEREGRYVIPIKAENRRDIKGIVHDVSNTGATLFVEPWTTLELGNDVRELLSQERYEIERILRDVSAKVAAHADDINRSVGLVAEFDLALAKAKYAIRTHAVEPRISPQGERPVLKLRMARHPLLGDKAVPLSVDIGNDFSILVITGPNMGGKTVALKTVGLLSLMALSGLPIPASEESTVPFFDGVFADIGDEQSIEQTVSTFSWHVGNIVRIVENSTPRSLVLLDELGAATDPAEGSALARAILLYLLSRGILTVATSHYDDMKAFAHSTEGLQNASLDLDPVSRLPTYHLTVGIPGGSNALAVAEHLGLPRSIIDEALDMLGKGTQELESLLLDLGREKGSLAEKQTRIDEERKALDLRRDELEIRASRVMEQERRLLERTRDVIVKEAADLQRNIREATAQLKKAKTEINLAEARTTLAKVHQELKSAVWSPPKADEPVDDGAIKPGDTVVLRDAGVRGKVLSISAANGQAEVLAGMAKMTISLGGLEKAAESKTTAPKQNTITKQVSRERVSMQLDLRGKRADEVETALDNYLNTASLAGLGEVRIVHGMATGTVRKIVRDMLSSHPLVRSYRPGERAEGGDGATVVRL